LIDEPTDKSDEKEEVVDVVNLSQLIRLYLFICKYRLHPYGVVINFPKIYSPLCISFFKEFHAD
jgi:hypothetical protein